MTTIELTEDLTTDETTEGAPESLTGPAEMPEDAPEAPVDAEDTAEASQDDPETFPKSYVEKLRKESAKYRDRAKRVDDYAHRLHTALVAATGRLADPEDLPFSEDHLEDPDALTAAIDELTARKPHLASRRPSGNIGQGPKSDADSVSLGGILRAGSR